VTAGPPQEDGSAAAPWWRWFAGFWVVLGLVAAGLREWGTAGLAGLFVTGFLAQEVRAAQRGEPRPAAARPLLLSALAAVLGAASVYLVLRFTWHVTAAWEVALVVLGALFLLYAAGPEPARRVRGTPDADGPGPRERG
jgi:peptidoglycan/LPS O-acetylase OafA/YrhL